jgi:hypothetical protein
MLMQMVSEWQMSVSFYSAIPLRLEPQLMLTVPAAPEALHTFIGLHVGALERN